MVARPRKQIRIRPGALPAPRSVVQDPPKKKSFFRRVWDNGGRTAAVVGGSLLAAGLVGRAAKGRLSRTGVPVGRTESYLGTAGPASLFATADQKPYLHKTYPKMTVQDFPDFPTETIADRVRSWGLRPDGSPSVAVAPRPPRLPIPGLPSRRPSSAPARDGGLAM